ncbi:hypothetical protein DYB38_010844 [Aphanomyces astaci]|uniref:Conserved oligomeric Golgi complex subunit 7 n=1 Tax=Aphanomyces astaci TaxID=112090 RepID=A0A397CLY4_APHAT|nr:hypothetical protein DYB38_010844 [Aphanomyces astaci]
MDSAVLTLVELGDDVSDVYAWVDANTRGDAVESNNSGGVSERLLPQLHVLSQELSATLQHQLESFPSFDTHVQLLAIKTEGLRLNLQSVTTFPDSVADLPDGSDGTTHNLPCQGSTRPRVATTARAAVTSDATSPSLILLHEAKQRMQACIHALEESAAWTQHSRVVGQLPCALSSCINVHNVCAWFDQSCGFAQSLLTNYGDVAENHSPVLAPAIVQVIFEPYWPLFESFATVERSEVLALQVRELVVPKSGPVDADFAALVEEATTGLWAALEVRVQFGLSFALGALLPAVVAAITDTVAEFELALVHQVKLDLDKTTSNSSTRVADILLSLLPQLELFAETSGLPNAVAASHHVELLSNDAWTAVATTFFPSNSVNDDWMSQSATPSFVDRWTVVMASGAMAVLTSQILQIPRFSATGAAQLACDMGYFENVLMALGVPLHPILAHIRHRLTNQNAPCDTAIANSLDKYLTVTR